MFEKTKGLSAKRIEEAARTRDAVDRARAFTNAALGQAQDRLRATIGKDHL